jgi:transcription initiation factor IIF auxiliary subunit
MPSFRLMQSQKFEGDDWWSWSVWIEGGPADLTKVESVEYTLHPTFPEPVRTVTTRGNKFKLTTGGWGTFPVYARVQLKNGEVVKLRHQLDLRYPDGTRTTA